jgi:signal transduction histidine kinase
VAVVQNSFRLENMNASLEDFRKKLIGTMGWGTGLIWLSFAILFQSLVLLIAQNQMDLAVNRLGSALNGFVSAHEGKVAIVATNPELRTFLRSGSEGRAQTDTAVLTLMASLRDEFVGGVRLVESQTGESLAEIGDFDGQVLAFDLCYIGDQLNAQFGRCAASVMLFLDGDRALKDATQAIEQIAPCAACRTQITDYLVKSRFLKLSALTNFPVHISPSEAQLGTFQLFFLLISLLVVGLGMFFRSIVGKGIKQNIVDPLSSLLTQMEKGTQVDWAANTSVAEVVALHKHNSTFSAIARTTQMLAHDVRKPFNLFHLTLERIKFAKGPQEMQLALQEALPEVERSLANVNGLITDVLNIGGEFNLVLKPVRLASVVDDVVDELRRLFPARSLNIQAKVPSELYVMADETRLPRVFLNILSNAVEAIPTEDVSLWIIAQAKSPDFAESAEIRVGNLGSYIEPEFRAHLFDLFFTSGKTGGTGLGLAIVKKIVTQHGGSVVCTSEKNDLFPRGKVEFKLTLKCASPAEEKTAAASATPAEEHLAVSNRQDSKNEEPTAAVQDEKPLVVFLDDSPLVRWAWENKLKHHVSIRCFAGPKAFFEMLNGGSSPEDHQLNLQSLHTIITDHYFAPDDRMTGIEFAKELRRLGFTGRILLASNGEFSPHELAGIVDKIVDKQPVGWENLKA